MKRTTCTVLTWILGIHLLYAQSIQLQTVVSAAHTNASNGTINLSGNFGQSIANSDAGALSGGFYSSISTLLQENFAPNINVLAEYQFSAFNIIQGDTIAADILDLDGVEYAAIWIRPIGGSAFDSIPLTIESGDKFTYALQSNDYDEMGIEYYFVAKDVTDRRRRHPTTGSLFAYGTSPQVTFPNTLINLGSLAEDYRMISVPYQINQNEVATLFSALIDLGDYDKSKWRLFSHDGDNNFSEYPDGSAKNLNRGKGYWLLISDKNNQTLELGTNVTASENNQDNLFSIDLQSGWNMIGNPYTVPISWENVRTYNSAVNIGVIKLFEGDYANGDELLPFQGGIAYLEGAATSIEIPFSGQTLSGGRLMHRPFETTLSAKNWKVEFKIEQGSHSNSLGGIGMHTEAKNGKDYFDDHNPPRFLSYLEMNFAHPEHPLGFFSKDIVESQSQYKWQLELNSYEDGPITLSWDNSGFGEHAVEMYLYDVQNQMMLDMRSSNKLTTGNNSNLEIYYGKDVLEQMGPDQSFVGAPYPNPMTNHSSSMVFPVILTSQEAIHNVDAIIYSKEGRMIKQIYQGDLTSGLHKLNWNGISEYGKEAPSGMYFYRISIHSSNKQRQFTGKLIISK
ncbi:MAG: FlgD immunoglobulin-like domain containing protein [Reichenbachiella sp.]|uniref:FlgD immunoglobulin-like domain containing protein n=1 Tax=Reichenbachiella sp. TaxID=2184521 RepID=UPI00326456FD